jgi:hypothetical protein
MKMKVLLGTLLLLLPCFTVSTSYAHSPTLVRNCSPVVLVGIQWMNFFEDALSLTVSSCAISAIVAAQQDTVVVQSDGSLPDQVVSVLAAPILQGLAWRASELTPATCPNGPVTLSIPMLSLPLFGIEGEIADLEARFAMLSLTEGHLPFSHFRLSARRLRQFPIWKGEEGKRARGSRGLVDCANSRTLIVRNPEHLYGTSNRCVFTQSSTTSNTLEPDNPKALVIRIERVMSVRETNRVTESGPVCTPFARTCRNRSDRMT